MSLLFLLVSSDNQSIMQKHTCSILAFGLFIFLAAGCSGGGSSNTQSQSAVSNVEGTHSGSYGYSDGGFYSATGYVKVNMAPGGAVVGVFRNTSTAEITDADPNTVGPRDSGAVSGTLNAGQGALTFAFQHNQGSNQFPVNGKVYSAPYQIYTQGRLKLLKMRGDNWAVVLTVGTVS